MTFSSQFSNTTHKMSHRYTRNKTNKFYSILIKSKLVLDFREHQIHHKTHTKNYSVLTGWSNPLLNLLL